jgi:uncharacterized protein YutE (UPF0331/DUF86 family)
MKTLSDAWKWYNSARRNLERMRRLGKKHWVGLPWDTHPIGQDEEFKTLEAPDIEEETAASLEPIDDLAIVVLFSVFESLVRSHVVEIIGPEAAELADPILRHAADDAIRGVQEGSFYSRVLEPLKEQGRVSADLVTRVNQVRDYRNWVAHGRRDRPKNNIEPLEAYERLSDFLDALGIAVEPELSEPGA